jgi:glycosyltransferase involved in cell wall biosynthesis
VALAGLAESSRGATVYAPHNVEHRIVRELATAAGPAHRPFLEWEWRKIRAEERRALHACGLTLAVSEIDAAAMRSEGARHVELCPNGADAMALAPWAPPSAGEALRLLFVGTGDYPPYELGLRWFVREALPLLRADGAVVLDVVGVPPREPLHAEGVTYHGRVPAVTPFYERAHALVIPVFQGSGTRLKAVEAAAAGRPIVSTRLGVEGLPLREGREYLRAEDAEGWARVAAQLRTTAPDAMIRAAEAAVGPLRWSTITATLAERYSTMTR